MASAHPVLLFQNVLIFIVVVIVTIRAVHMIPVLERDLAHCGRCASGEIVAGVFQSANDNCVHDEQAKERKDERYARVDNVHYLGSCPVLALNRA